MRFSDNVPDLRNYRKNHVREQNGFQTRMYSFPAYDDGNHTEFLVIEPLLADRLVQLFFAVLPASAPYNAFQKESEIRMDFSAQLCMRSDNRAGRLNDNRFICAAAHTIYL